MTGVITKIKLKTDTEKGGYGFIRDENGNDRFFHANDLLSREGKPANGLFWNLREGDRVTFEATAGNQSRGGKGNGLRAVKVSLC